MKLGSVLFAVGVALATSACSRFGGGPPAGGMLTGSIADSALGSVAARAMDDSDRRRAAAILESLPDGQSSVWRNHETGDRFVFTPLRSFARGGTRCRDFRLEVTVGARFDGIGASACLQADGDWRMSR